MFDIETGYNFSQSAQQSLDALRESFCERSEVSAKSNGRVTQILSRLRERDGAAATGELYQLVYSELRALADSKFRRCCGVINSTLARSPTAIHRQNVLPPCSLARTDSEPPRFSAIQRAIGRPRPAPAEAPVEIALICVNVSKMRAWSSGRITPSSPAVNSKLLQAARGLCPLYGANRIRCWASLVSSDSTCSPLN